jgi:lipooligosaccharide transport system ATP-binding protein
MGVVPQLDNLDVTLTVEQNLLVFTHLYRVAAPSGRRDRARAGDRKADRPRARKVDKLSAACAGGC